MLVLELLDRALPAARPAACFAAGYALADRFDLVGAEPDLPTALFPEQRRPEAVGILGGALAGLPPGCWVDPEPALLSTPAGGLPSAPAVPRHSWRPHRGAELSRHGARRLADQVTGVVA